MPPLRNPKHEKFAQALVAGRSATEAYVAAGYKPNDGNAIRLKGNERICARVAEMLGRAAAKVEVTRERILEELEHMALSDMKSFARWGLNPPLTEEQRQALDGAHFDGIPARQRELDDKMIRFLKEVGLYQPAPTIEIVPSDELSEVSRAVQQVKVDSNGAMSLKLYDKQRALELLGREKHGMFVEKHKHDHDVTFSWVDLVKSAGERSRKA